MAGFWNKLVSSEAKDVSSKRVAGLYCICIYSLILITTFVSNLEVTGTIKDLLDTLFYGGTALLGIGIFDKPNKTNE